MVTAVQTTGGDGQPLVNGFDLSNLRRQESGEGKANHWNREVTYRASCLLSAALVADKLIKFNLLANILIDDEKVNPNAVVDLYSSGAIKEARIGNTRYRLRGTQYLGKAER